MTIRDVCMCIVPAIRQTPCAGGHAARTTASSASSGSDQPTNIALIGGVVGGLVALLIIIVAVGVTVLVVLIKRKHSVKFMCYDVYASAAVLMVND